MTTLMVEQRAGVARRWKFKVKNQFRSVGNLRKPTVESSSHPGRSLARSRRKDRPAGRAGLTKGAVGIGRNRATTRSLNEEMVKFDDCLEPEFDKGQGRLASRGLTKTMSHFCIAVLDGRLQLRTNFY